MTTKPRNPTEGRINVGIIKPVDHAFASLSPHETLQSKYPGNYSLHATGHEAKWRPVTGVAVLVFAGLAWYVFARP
jgi:hypothetical protein